jgi:SAM-dependent methyltransferase
MIDNFTEEERKKIKEGIEDKYRKVSVTPKGNFRYPVGREGLDTLGYDPEILEKLPEEVLDTYCGVGNLFSTGTVSEGEKILDIGCGAGVDSIIAALKTGPKGTVIGMDLSGEMIARAEQNRSKAVIENVTFIKGSAEDLPFSGESFCLVISNGVFNLVPDKVTAIREVLRVLKPGGRFLMADQVLVSERRTNRASFVAEWAG